VAGKGNYPMAVRHDARTLFAAATSFTGGRVFPVLSRDAGRAAGLH